MMRSLARPAFTMFLSCIKAGFGGRIRTRGKIDGLLVRTIRHPLQARAN